eukprot:916984-Pelagomonas_calceolata.AAC.5
MGGEVGCQGGEVATSHMGGRALVTLPSPPPTCRQMCVLTVRQISNFFQTVGEFILPNRRIGQP